MTDLGRHHDTGSLFDLSPRGHGRVVLSTVLSALFCIAVAVYVDSFSFSEMTQERLHRAMLIDVLVPLALAAPLTYFLASKLRELAVAHHELSVLASTDSLTSVLNRRAFTAMVEAYLDRVSSADGQPHGALLIVDADHFKQINDTYGHDSGDTALQILAGAIRNAVRGDIDLVGRMGGEEFGVFLPGASPRDAVQVGERVRRAVSQTGFEPNGATMTVSVGGAVFNDRVSFGDLFRGADQQLYRAKENGRNRTEIGQFSSLQSPIKIPEREVALFH